MSYQIGLGSPTVYNSGFTLWIWSVVMVILSGIFVLTRMGIRYHSHRLGVDDWTIFASLISSVLLSLTECSAVHYGYGMHSADLDPKNEIIALKWFFAAQIMYKVVITVNKISFLCLYLRIFIQPTFRKICFGGIVFLVCWGLAYILVTIFQCLPVDAFWDHHITKKSCVNSEAQWLSYAVINILSDVSILALPMFPISKLRLPRAEKMALACLFSLGALVCVTSIVRTTTLAGSATNKDPTSGPVPATIWSVIEANAGIICSCLPVFKKPLDACLPGLFGGSQQSQMPSSRNGTGSRHHQKGHLQDSNNNAWQQLHGGNATFSNKVTTSGDYELYAFGLAKQPHNPGITQVTDVEVSYQHDDQKSDISARPLKGSMMD